jgi:membrane-associated phospholipid phosphatase
MITTFVFTSLCVQIAKYFFDDPRPRLYFQKEISKLRFVKGVEILDHHSFPSGHTLTAFATGVLLTYLAKNKSWGVLLVLFGVLVGFSRMYLSEHFFEDVIGGSVMGVFLTIFWISWLDSRKFMQTSGWKRGLLRS